MVLAQKLKNPKSQLYLCPTEPCWNLLQNCIPSFWIDQFHPPVPHLHWNCTALLKLLPSISAQYWCWMEIALNYCFFVGRFQPTSPHNSHSRADRCWNFTRAETLLIAITNKLPQLNWSTGAARWRGNIVTTAVVAAQLCCWYPVATRKNFSQPHSPIPDHDSFQIVARKERQSSAEQSKLEEAHHPLWNCGMRVRSTRSAAAVEGSCRDRLHPPYRGVVVRLLKYIRISSRERTKTQRSELNFSCIRITSRRTCPHKSNKLETKGNWWIILIIVRWCPVDTHLLLVRWLGKVCLAPKTRSRGC